ncbi:TetR/AcrR family transcriptional regulator [Eikenella sp. Marseille-P7795]|uniref:TetR/AcrR family transcriptional regulator n=1 Tax=Eikenella sp. Marseille-P7795 TaxID=2866577 RepID=UPI001CE44CE5|nr:TetR/AcrR family transcriptional regulator [Eikenella sp. Marseille-P7795]
MPLSKKQQTLRETARKLFYQQGFAAVSVEALCAAAEVSRVTFYKYYAGKNALVAELFAEHKEGVRLRLESLLAQQCSLEQAAAELFRIQQASLADLYSAAVLRDIENITDLELERFFHDMEEEKYRFMRGFFHTLQQRNLIQPSLPVELIELFIRQMDGLMRLPQISAHYAANPQQLPQDILHLLLYGLTSREHRAD